MAARYAACSPSALVAEWQTPTLVIHGGKDYRLVDGEGLATFTALQRQGVPSELLYFPTENHWVLSPMNSVVWHDRVLGWLERWLGEKLQAAEGAKFEPVPEQERAGDSREAEPLLLTPVRSR